MFANRISSSTSCSTRRPETWPPSSSRSTPPSSFSKLQHFPFLRNHATGIASLDLFVVRTISFKLLYGLVILQHGRRRLARVGISSNRPPSGSLVK